LTSHPPLSILVLEDDDASRIVAQNVLRAVDFNVLCARDFNEAIEFVEAGANIDIAVVDVRMPPGTPDGFSFARAARQKHPALKVIFMSGRQSARDFSRMQDDDAFLCKPFVPHQLLEFVTRAAWER
jgi:CheY-like chemotaxis protein